MIELEYQRLPNWVLELVADLQEYEDTHPPAAPAEPGHEERCQP